ncbi:hypothetical protein [Butyrivibrio sp. AE2032]|uniref:hypothetical protein n=1 Tax=Butyrivibrio sp. AE2032 TaxID=1458463 RepID=UPI000A7D9006|nr:hypothetical protein [Butyrivibrio sp. AE2032]
MEIEISESDKAEVFVVPYDDSEYTEVIKSTAAAINKKVEAFMDRKLKELPVRTTPDNS